MAVVHEDCSVGTGTRVWQFASIIRGAVLGKDCSVASCAIVDGCRLGDRVIVSHGAFLDPGMKIGSDVFVGPHVAFCNDYWPVVSKDGWFDVIDLTTGRKTVSIVEDHASIGANAVLMPGVRIGRGAMVAAGSVVVRSVPDHHLYQRQGGMVPIDAMRIPSRMREAK